jgi:methylated-DNA-protein-cysteine methyltransferase related protein
MPSAFYQAVYKMVRKIPKGKVASYGQIATLVGKPRAAQMVGWALHLLDKRPDASVPWHRVLNRHGMISTTCLEHTADEQAWRLQKEGVKVVKKDQLWFVDLEKYLWNPRIIRH